jgi:hypothetical protein
VWRSPEDLLEPAAALRLPDSWLAHEDHVRWKTRTALPAEMLCRNLLRAGRPRQLQTTIDGLAESCASSPEQIRDALDGFLYCRWASVSRHGRPLDRRQLASLPAHAKFRLDLDWPLVGDVDADEDLDPSVLRWQASPWGVYRAVAADERISVGTVRIVAECPFEVTKPSGGTFLASLGDLAAAQGMSVPKVVKRSPNSTMPGG